VAPRANVGKEIYTSLVLKGTSHSDRLLSGFSSHQQRSGILLLKEGRLLSVFSFVLKAVSLITGIIFYASTFSV
jgi:hypothetical protein